MRKTNLGFVCRREKTLTWVKKKCFSKMLPDNTEMDDTIATQKRKRLDELK